MAEKSECGRVRIRKTAASADALIPKLAKSELHVAGKISSAKVLRLALLAGSR